MTQQHMLLLWWIEKCSKDTDYIYKSKTDISSVLTDSNGWWTATAGKAGHGIKENYFFNSLTLRFRAASSSWLPMVLQSLTDTPHGTAVTCRHFLCYYSHLQTLPMLLQSLADTPYGITVTCRQFLWYYSHFQTIPVVLQSLTDTLCGTTVTHIHSVWYYCQ